MTGLGRGFSFWTGRLPGESGMAGDSSGRRTVGGTRIRLAGEDGPPVADAEHVADLSRQVEAASIAAHTAGFAS